MTGDIVSLPGANNCVFNNVNDNNPHRRVRPSVILRKYSFRLYAVFVAHIFLAIYQTPV